MSMPELPLAMIMVILSRLPIITILRCRCVCKTWLNMISDPYFTRMHLERAPVSLVFNIPSNVSYYYRRLYVLALQNLDITHDSFAPLKQLPLEINNLGENLELETSCNGLLCITGIFRKKPVTYVCNVITGEYMTLPRPKNDKLKRKICGFGFSQITKQYKVIQGIYQRGQFYSARVEVYTLGTKKWRNIGDLPHSFVKPYYYNDIGPFLNGALHWLVQPHNNSTFICQFDIENEQLKSFPSPPVQDFGPTIHKNSMHLGVSGGFLYLCENLSTSSSVEIWVMKDYGVKQSWTKEFVISNPQWRSETVHILNYGLNKKMEAMEGAELYVLHGSKLSAYNNRRHVRELDVCGINTYYNVIPYVPSLVSLKEVVIGKKSQVFCA